MDDTCLLNFLDLLAFMRTVLKLRTQAQANGQILQVSFFPDVDSMNNPDALIDQTMLAQAEFVDVPPTP